MVKVTATIKLEFLSEPDKEMIKENLYQLISDKMEEDDLMDGDVRIKLSDEEEDEYEPDLEEDGE